jgi:hypothetical protein
MTFFVGFDCLAYPGTDEMTWLKANTNLGWCGFYLAPAPSHSDSSWIDCRSNLDFLEILVSGPSTVTKTLVVNQRVFEGGAYRRRCCPEVH